MFLPDFLKIVQEKIEKIKSMHKSGMTVEEISEELNISWKVIRKILRLEDK